MRSVNFVVLGDQSVAAGFGRRGTQTDLTLYDKKRADTVRTWVAPVGFPEKIQPLIQAINMAEYAILHLDALDRFAGEQIVALDILGMGEGILASTYDVDDSLLDSMIRGTVLERYARVRPDDIIPKMEEFGPAPGTGPARAVVDHSFLVGGTGTVVLARVTSGAIKKYDRLRLLPAGRDILIKSIQMHDVDVAEARSPARVGLLLKDVRPGEISRGDILCEGEIPVRTRLDIDFEKCPFHKGGIVAGRGCLVGVGLQIKPAKILSDNPLRLALEKPVVCGRGETCIVLRPESGGIRIMGSGDIL